MNEKELKPFEDLKNKIFEEYAKGNIVYMTIDGCKSISISDFITQQVDGILYDLNRLEEVIATNITDKKWVNDFALTKLVRYLYSELIIARATGREETK